jgi:hypothetical protein
VGSTFVLAHPLYYDRLVQLASTIFGMINEQAKTLLDPTLEMRTENGEEEN